MSEELENTADHIEAEWYANPRPTPVYTGPDGRIRVVLDAPAELLTMNTARGRIHWREWAELTKAWRDAMHDRALFLGIPAVTGRVGVEGYPRVYQGILADAGAHMPCVKACVDGLRDAGVLADDDPEHVAYVRCWAPIKGVGAGMVLELVPA
jgi:hypothetical protein